MARVFVGLKLRLLRNRLSTGGFLPGVGFFVLWLAALAGGLAGGVLFGVLARVAPGSIAAISVVLFTVVGVTWLIVPVVLASIDDSLEARTFELLPLSPGQLARGLLTAGLIGPGTLATVLGLGYGAMLAFGTGLSAIPVLVVALTAVLLSVSAARWATTRLSDLLRRRRGQEIALLFVVALSLLPALLGVTLAESNAPSVSLTDLLHAAAGMMQWTPWGALGRSVAAIGAGEWAIAAGGFVYGSLATAAFVFLFARALRRLAVTAPSSTVARTGREKSQLLPRRLPLPASPVGAVAAKELIAVRRDVRVRSQLLGGIVAVLVIGVAGGSVAIHTPYGPFLAVLTVFIVITSITPNQFGYDGGSFWGYVTMAPDLGMVIRGKNLGWAIVAAPVAVLTAVATAALSGEWIYVPAALCGAAVMALIWLGLGNLTSIFGAFPLPETNLFGTRNMSGGAFLATMFGITASGILSLPPIVAVGLLVAFDQPVWATLAAAVSVGYAVLVYRIATRHAARLAHDRRFVLLGVLDQD